jgi:hypothetical protein
MLARGETGLAEALCALKGVTFGRRYVFRALYAIGGEGAVYDVDDLDDPHGPPLVGKIALHPVHQPFELTAEGIRERRVALRRESVLLATCGGDAMPEDVGHFQFENPALDAGRGDAFAEAEPVLLMDKLPGLDLDRWLARVHRWRSVRDARPTLDRFAVGLLRAIDDLASRGFLFADLRPGNMRVLPQPYRHVRLLDAGSIVRESEVEERFPHVPGYLPPGLFHAMAAGEPVQVSHEVLAEMAGRTLFEVATGEPPYPGEAVDLGLLEGAAVSPEVAAVVRALTGGELDSVRSACDHVAGVVDEAAPPRVERAARVPKKPEAAAAGGDDWAPADFLFQGDVELPPAARRAEPEPDTAPIAPPPRRPLWRRLRDRLFRRRS